MFERPAFKTLVLGVGNKLMSDEGVGVHVIERLSAGFSDRHAVADAGLLPPGPLAELDLAMRE